MLIVELDGSQHSEDTSVAADAVRTKYLGGLGYFVMRFWNADINRDVCGVVETIYATAVSRSNTPSSALRAPSPQGEKANTAATE